MKPLDPVRVPLRGTLLVEASAGTGKTYTITTLFVRLLVEDGLSVREIVVVTFTEAATAELRGRIRARLREALAEFAAPGSTKDEVLRALVDASPNRALANERLERALSELDLAAISTIHAFCLRALQERAFESGVRFDLELIADATELMREVAEDYWASRMIPMRADLYRARAKEFELETARSLIDTFTRRPLTLPVLPESVPPDPELLRVAVEDAYASARVTWQTSNDDIRALVKGAPLRRSGPDGYPEEHIDPWCDELDEVFAAPDASFCVSEGLKKMTTTSLAAGTLARAVPPEHNFFRVAERLHSLSTRAQRDLIIRLKRGAVDYVRREMPVKKGLRGVQGFEDLLFSLDRALTSPSGPALAEALRGQFKAALIDEFQDTDPVQFRIFRTIFHGSRTLLLVGDPKQSIYAFRGADVFSYITASEDAKGAAYTLDTNHRSDPSLVTAVNTLFRRAKKPVFVLPQIGFESVKAWAKEDRITLPSGHRALEILFVPRTANQRPHAKTALETQLPDLVAAEIARVLTSKGTKIEGKLVVAGDIAVLTRTNDQARDMQQALRNLGIPTALESEASIFESPEAAEVEQVLRAVLEPTRLPLVKTALATSIIGLSADQIVALEADEAGWQRWSDRLRAVQDDWSEAGFVQAYRRMLIGFNVERRLLSLVDGERRMTNLLHLGELLHLASVRERFGPTGTLRWLSARRVEKIQRGFLDSDAGELRLESDARSVKILTVHKSKGLEWPIVYCPFLWALKVIPNEVATAFHDPNDSGRLKIHLDPPESIQDIAETEGRAENMRLLYVALTRAKHRCSIVWGGINLAEDTPLANTLHPRSAGTSAYKRTDAELRQDLAKLVEESGGTISVRDLVPTAPPSYVPEDVTRAELRARTYERQVDTWWRIGSFSALASGERAAATIHEARDRDEGEEEASAPDEGASASSERVILDEFPRGAKAGVLMHAVLEDHDFISTDRAELEALIQRKLVSHGFAKEGLATLLARGLDAMLDTPLDAAGLKLRSIPRSRRVDELEFMLPVAHTQGEVTTKRIANAFAAHASPEILASYSDQLRLLGFLPLRGFLRGFIDLVFEHDGRFYVVDYKSNHLGSTANDYARGRLATAMAHSHYYLQYHLYVVAVDRWLRRRMRGYDYEKSFGGVLYLFARGTSPLHPPGTGVFFDRPRPAMVRALSEVLDG